MLEKKLNPLNHRACIVVYDIFRTYEIWIIKIKKITILKKNRH